MRIGMVRVWRPAAGSHPLRVVLRSPGRRRLWLARQLATRGWLQSTLEVRHVDVPVRDLPSHLEGFCIAQVSDLHVGDGMWRPPHVTQVASVIRDAAPDLVVNTGDLVCGVPAVTGVVAVAAHVSARSCASQIPSLAVLGNHDYYAGDETVRGLFAGLAGHGTRVLTNEAVCIERPGGGVSIVGLTAYAPGFERGLEALCSAARPRVVLCHEPDLAERIPHGSADLVLSGHTHGGQVVFPGLQGQIVRMACGSRYVEGRYRVNGGALYVNRGLGFVGLPLRLGARPEVSLIRLVH